MANLANLAKLAKMVVMNLTVLRFSPVLGEMGWGCGVSRG